jgi:hypothetical protein
MSDPYAKNRDAAAAFGRKAEEVFKAGGEALDALNGKPQPQPQAPKNPPTSNGGTTININNY